MLGLGGVESGLVRAILQERACAEIVDRCEVLPRVGHRVAAAVHNRCEWIGYATFGHGPETLVLLAEALQLLLSLASGITNLSSLQASKKYVPAAVLETVTVTVPLEVVPGSSEGTARLPLSIRAPLLDAVAEK